MKELSIENKKKLLNIADKAFSNYDFDYLSVSDSGSWEVDNEDGSFLFSKVCSARDEDEEELKVTFKVRLTKEGKVLDAVALDMDSGAELGFIK